MRHVQSETTELIASEMLRANVYTGSAKTSGRVQKSTMSATTQATTDSTRSHVDRERDREDGVHCGTSHPASVRDDGSVSRAALRSIASRRMAAAGCDLLTRRARDAQGSVASRISRSAQSARREVLFVLEIIQGVLQGRAKGVPLGVSLVGV